MLRQIQTWLFSGTNVRPGCRSLFTAMQTSVCLTFFALYNFAIVIMYFVVQCLVNVKAVSNCAGCSSSYDDYTWSRGVDIFHQCLAQALLTNLIAHRYLLSKVRKYFTLHFICMRFNRFISLLFGVPLTIQGWSHLCNVRVATQVL
jgi:hypothetical protein